MNANHFIDLLKQTLESYSKPERAEKMAAYMRDQFAFLGVAAPERKAVVKAIVQAHGLPPIKEWQKLIRLCFEMGEARELAYAAGDILIPKKKKLSADWLPLIEELIVSSAWWDTVDWLAPHLAAAILTKIPDQVEPVTRRWIQSDNIWLQRSAIIFQLHSKQATNETLLYEHIRYRADSNEFFVQKGAGWALRQYSKTNPQSVKQFIDQYADIMAPLTIREGMKVILKA
jgi:3-methyladenine DNA glycosylase AlkD